MCLATCGKERVCCPIDHFYLEMKGWEHSPARVIIIKQRVLGLYLIPLFSRDGLIMWSKKGLIKNKNSSSNNENSP